jgi:hypothetical protein
LALEQRQFEERRTLLLALLDRLPEGMRDKSPSYVCVRPQVCLPDPRNGKFSSIPGITRGGSVLAIRGGMVINNSLLIAITPTVTNGSISGVYQCVETNGALTLNPATMSGERTNTRGGRTNPTIAVIVVSGCLSV